MNVQGGLGDACHARDPGALGVRYLTQPGVSDVGALGEGLREQDSRDDVRHEVVAEHEFNEPSSVFSKVLQCFKRLEDRLHLQESQGSQTVDNEKVFVPLAKDQTERNSSNYGKYWV